MIHFELTPASAKPNDHVFVITKKQKADKHGKLYLSRGYKREDYEVIEAVISQIRFGWSAMSTQNVWSCDLSTVGEDPKTWRYIEDVSPSDCYSTREEAEKELDQRFTDEE